MKDRATVADVEIGQRFRVFEQNFTLRFSYPVYFTRGVLSDDNGALDRVLLGGGVARPARACFVIDDGLLPHYPSLAEQVLARGTHAKNWELAGAPIFVPGGEKVKNDPHHVEFLYQRFADLGLDRHSYVVAVGGGAVLDAVGYAVATAHRGLRMVRVPTTVLAQNDSGVGVKNGINFLGMKNFLGTFAPPSAVLNDFEFLSSLSVRDRRAGMAEGIKVGLVRDPAFFCWLEEHAAPLAQGSAEHVEQLVERTAMLHLEHIASAGDPFESGSSRPLDFGHWVAHKLESLTSHELRHGEAVAIGLALDALYSAEVGLLPRVEADRVVRLIARLDLPLFHPALRSTNDRGKPAYLDGLEEFRQHLGGELSVTLLESLGRGVQVHEMDERLIERCCERLAQLATGSLGCS